MFAPLITAEKAGVLCTEEVVLPTGVTTPERFALVVTVLALPVMLMLTAEEMRRRTSVFTPVA